MSVGFRKSLFGFNCEDVVNYIEETNDKFAKKEKDLSSKISAVTEDLNKAKQTIEELENEKAVLSRTVNEYYAKQEEIERLSENIGKLYLVARTNAKAIMDSATENAEKSAKEVESNIQKISAAHTELNELRNHINEISASFGNEVESLIASLAETKESLELNEQSAEKSAADFKIVYNSTEK